ncbi:MAG: PEGA domain-containing protein, partial [Atribacterota bacterium]
MKKLLNTLKIFILILFLPFLIIACTTMPVPPVNGLGYGNIQVYSEPTDAYIYLDGTNTGYKTPGLLKNIYAGSHLLTLKMDGYLNSNDFVQVYPYQTTQLNIGLTPNPYLPYPEKNLLMIVVRPEIIEMPIGNWAYIDSIIAHYSDGTTKTLSTYQCNLTSSKPDVANIMADGKIVAFSEGQTTIWIDYSESGTTKSDSILVNVYKNPQGMGNLLSINILPKEMSLNIGESKTISSITAYYDNGTNRLISPYLCNFNIDNPIITVNNSGKITGIAEGTSVVTVSYSEGGIIKTDNLTVEVGKAPVDAPVYRSLSIGIGDYLIYGPEGDLLAPPYDVNKMTSMYRDCRFGFNNDSFLKIDTLVDSQATKNNILNKIRNTFSGSKENDISYFYFSGHGALLNQTSYLCPADFNGNVSTAISVDELESVLSTIPGKKIVLIDSCHSGGFIGKSGSAIEVNG